MYRKICEAIKQLGGDEWPATFSWFLEPRLVIFPLEVQLRPAGKAANKQNDALHRAQEENNLSPGPNLYFWMLHRRHPSFPVFSCIWSPWQRTSFSQCVPVRAEKVGGHLDGHGVSGPVSQKLKTAALDSFRNAFHSSAQSWADTQGWAQD